MVRNRCFVSIVIAIVCSTASAQTEGDPWSRALPSVVGIAPPPWSDTFDATAGALYLSFVDAVHALSRDTDTAPLLDELLAFVQRRAGVHRDARPVEGTCPYLGGSAGSLVADGGSGTLFADGGSGTLFPDGGSGTVFGDGGGVLEPFSAAHFALDDSVRAWSLLAVATADRDGRLFVPIELHDEIAIIDRFELDEFAEGMAGAFQSDLHRSLELAAALALWPRVDLDVVTGSVVVPHGHLVLHHTVQVLIGHHGGVRDVDIEHLHDPRRVEVTLTWSDTVSAKVTLLPMSFVTLDGLLDAMTFLAAPEQQRQRIVMSWTLSNCALIERYLAGTRDTVSGSPGTEHDASIATSSSYAAFVFELLAAGIAEDGQPLLAELCRAMRQADDELDSIPCDDAFALATLLADLDRRAYDDVGSDVRGLTSDALRRRTYAAAGNHRLPFPLPPASWPGVYGVAACTPTQRDSAWFSNRGDVVADEHLIAPGAWYFEMPFGDGAGELGYWGTSFAAPYAALRFPGQPGSHGAGPFALGTCDASAVPPLNGP